jgi:hypothetical protein
MGENTLKAAQVVCSVISIIVAITIASYGSYVFGTVYLNTGVNTAFYHGKRGGEFVSDAGEPYRLIYFGIVIFAFMSVMSGGLGTSTHKIANYGAIITSAVASLGFGISALLLGVLFIRGANSLGVAVNVASNKFKCCVRAYFMDPLSKCPNYNTTGPCITDYVLDTLDIDRDFLNVFIYCICGCILCLLQTFVNYFVVQGQKYADSLLDILMMGAGLRSNKKKKSKRVTQDESSYEEQIDMQDQYQEEEQEYAAAQEEEEEEGSEEEQDRDD